MTSKLYCPALLNITSRPRLHLILRGKIKQHWLKNSFIRIFTFIWISWPWVFWRRSRVLCLQGCIRRIGQFDLVGKQYGQGDDLGRIVQPRQRQLRLPFCGHQVSFGRQQILVLNGFLWILKVSRSWSRMRLSVTYRWRELLLLQSIWRSSCGQEPWRSEIRTIVWMG